MDKDYSALSGTLISFKLKEKVYAFMSMSAAIMRPPLLDVLTFKQCRVNGGLRLRIKNKGQYCYGFSSS